MIRFNTLYVIIDESLLPPECVRKYCDVIDCREINRFCSIIGDAVVGDLTNSEGVPLYRFLSPLGKILSDFQHSNNNVYDQIIKQWYSILADILNSFNNDDSAVYLKLPEEYSDWLIYHENAYLNQVGSHLLKNDNKIKLNRKGILESVVLNSVCKDIESQINRHSYDLIVFSNSVIKDNCDIFYKNSFNFKKAHFITTKQLLQWDSLIINNYNVLKDILKYDKLYLQNKTAIESAIDDSFQTLSHHITKIIPYSIYRNRLIRYSIKQNQPVDTIIEQKRNLFYKECFKITKKLFDFFCKIIEDYRTLNEYNQCFENENQIYKTLGLGFNTDPKDYVAVRSKRSIVLFPDVNIIIDNFTRIIGDSLGFSVPITLIENRGRLDYRKILKSLNEYYRFYCLEELKKSFDSLIKIYEPIIEESKGIKLCFLTNAMCSYYNKNDNCYELTFLRGFRDFWLKFQENGDKIIQHYYEIAPIILSKVNCDIQSDVAFEYIKNCIYDCIGFINAKQYMKAKNKYIRMVNYLIDKYKL